MTRDFEHTCLLIHVHRVLQSSSDHTMFFHTTISYHVFPAIFAPDRSFQSFWNSTKFPIAFKI